VVATEPSIKCGEEVPPSLGYGIAQAGQIILKYFLPDEKSFLVKN